MAAENARDRAGMARLTEDWRTILHAYALQMRELVIAGKTQQQHDLRQKFRDKVELVERLGPLTLEALRIVEAYALGAVTNEEGERLPDSPPPEFGARLNIVLNGLEQTGSPAETIGNTTPQVIQSDLWQLLYKVRESAEMAYTRELDLAELDRRILFLLHNVGPLVPAEIATAVGVDKAQVSRSVKRLLEIKMIEREQLRAPLQLTRKGRDHGERLLRLADLRNRELTFDIGDTELARFFAVIEKLLDQAMVLYEQERALMQGGEPAQFPRPGAAVESENGGGDKIAMDRSRIISPLMTLSSYFSRSGSLTFKRLTNLSNFEAWVLNEIGRAAPIEWAVLVERLDRDHSQAGRTVKALLDRDLIVREGKPGRRHGRFSPSAEGQKLYQVIQDASHQRSGFLLAPLSQAERKSFLETFDKIRRNAVVQLERERAFEDLAKG